MVSGQSVAGQEQHQANVKQELSHLKSVCSLYISLCSPRCYIRHLLQFSFTFPLLSSRTLPYVFVRYSVIGKTLHLRGN